MKSNVLFVIAAAAASVGLLTFAAPPPSGDIAASAAPKAPALANIDQWFNSPPL